LTGTRLQTPASVASGRNSQTTRVAQSRDIDWSGAPRRQTQREAEEVLLDEALMDIDEPFRTGSPATTARSCSERLYANPVTHRRVNLPSLISLLLGPHARGDDPASTGPRDDKRARFETRPMLSSGLDLRPVLGRIDWDCHGEELRHGRIDHLFPDIVDLIRRAAEVPTIAALARTWGIHPITAVVGLVAQPEASSDRAAMRVARRILDEAVASEVSIAMREVGL
jgi:hypothetical protein